MPAYIYWSTVTNHGAEVSEFWAFLVSECDKYYTKDSLVGDPDYGPILSSLLVGPCALEFTKVKTTW